MKPYMSYLLEQGAIPIDKLILTEGNSDEGKTIAKALGVTLRGWWDELNQWVFNDDEVTESSFTAKDMEEAKRKLANLRKAFELGAQRKKEKEMQLANA